MNLGLHFDRLLIIFAGQLTGLFWPQHPGKHFGDFEALRPFESLSVDGDFPLR